MRRGLGHVFAEYKITEGQLTLKAVQASDVAAPQSFAQFGWEHV
jgi:hypothetical protein